MKKTLLSLILLAGGMLCANAQMTSGAQARVYAYDLQQEATTTVVNETTLNATTVTFKTNTAATSAKIILFAEGKEDIEVTASPVDETGKLWTATIHAAISGITAGDYNWKAEVSAGAVTAWTLISDHTNNADNFIFYRSYGLAIDKNPENNTFGTIYVANQATGTGYTKGKGIFTYNPELNLSSTSGYSVDCVGDGSVSGASPSDMAIDATGKLYLSNYTTTAPGIYIVDPNDNYSSKNIFEGTLDTSTGIISDSNGDLVASRIVAVGVYGENDNREIFTIDLGSNSTDTYPYYVSRYEIGTSETWTTPASWVCASDGKFNNPNGTTFMLYNRNAAIEPTSEGYWISCYRGTTGAAQPILAYLNNDNEVKYNISVH